MIDQTKVLMWDKSNRQYKKWDGVDLRDSLCVDLVYIVHMVTGCLPRGWFWRVLPSIQVGSDHTSTFLAPHGNVLHMLSSNSCQNRPLAAASLWSPEHSKTLLCLLNCHLLQFLQEVFTPSSIARSYIYWCLWLSRQASSQTFCMWHLQCNLPSLIHF